MNENKITDSMLIWASAFSNLLQFSAKEKSLVQATVVYKRPSTLTSMLTNYKKVAHSTTENAGQGRFQPWKKCALCGCFNHYKSMVHQTSSITAANGKIFALKQILDCSNYGIYVAACRLCHKQYIGQTRPTIRPGLAGTVPEFKVLSRSAERKSRFFMEPASYASLLRQKFSY